jgi:hypothetical protein
MSATQTEAAASAPAPPVVIWAPLASGALREPSFLASEPKEPAHLNSPRIADATTSAKASRSLDECLFDNAADLKIAFAQIAMHLSPDWRRTIFKQLDRLLDLNSWEDDSALIERIPFMTFLRFVIYAAPTRFPSLGVSPHGHVLAAWMCPPQQILVLFLEA